MSSHPAKQAETPGTLTVYQREQLEILRRIIQSGRELAVNHALREQPESDDTFVDIYEVSHH